MLNARCSLIIILSTLLLSSCATSNRSAYKDLRKKVQAGKVDEAVLLVESNKFYPEKRNKLVKLVELGTLRQIQKDYYQALLSFNKAKALSDKLFTVSLSKKALAAVTNNNQDKLLWRNL